MKTLFYVLLGGPCRAGKTTLVSMLIGEKVPLKWNSTDGLVIYFGKNGIDIDKRKMVPFKQGILTYFFNLIKINVLIYGVY